jgi:2-polyprenyl-3-methyl-5-hydroxy-6-metoxy-1,4-benzoquinol methylase
MSVRIGPPLSEQELCPAEMLKGQESALARDIARLLARSDEFVVVACPACGETRQNASINKYGFCFVACPECQTLYMSPRPSRSQVADYYANSENYAYWAQYIFPASESARREKVHKPWVDRVIGYCDRLGVHPGTLVEVGPGVGTFASAANESGRFSQVITIEPTPELAAACRKRGLSVISKRVEDVSETEIPPVDILCAFEVIEHLFHPAEFVAHAARLLQPGGLLIISCPNGLGFDIATLGADSLAVDNEHLNLFNPSSLSGLLSKFGLDVIEVNTPGRLDAEFVREAALNGQIDLASQPFLRRVLVDEWDRLGWPFQQFLAANSLSSHMWVAAQRI